MLCIPGSDMNLIAKSVQSPKIKSAWLKRCRHYSLIIIPPQGSSRSRSTFYINLIFVQPPSNVHYLSKINVCWQPGKRGERQLLLICEKTHLASILSNPDFFGAPQFFSSPDFYPQDSVGASRRASIIGGAAKQSKAGLSRVRNYWQTCLAE